MQTHGFARIYDAKVNSRDSLTRWLDFAFVLVWFGGVIVLCDQPASLLLSHYYNSGGPTVPAGWLAALRTLWLTGMILISAAFVAQSIRIWRQGRPANPVKFLLLSISIAFYWFAYSGAEHILVGAAMFDVFHDVQYLTIVWLFNRRRAASAGLAVGPFTRFVFGRSGALIGVYLGLIFAFGGIRYLETFAASPRAADMLNGFIAAMGLLHYYYDGFIWKLRDHDNRSALGITSTSTRTRRLDFMWPAHGAKWLLFAVPLVLLFWTQAHRKPDEIARAGALAETIPQSSTVQLDYARALENAAARRLARDQYARVLELDPTSIEAHRRTGGLCVSLGETTSGVRHLRRALQIDSTDLESRSMLGRALFKTGDFAAAEDELRQAAAIDSHSAVTVGDYGMALVATGKLAEAERVLRDALRRAPNSPQLHFQLGNALFRQGRRDDASAHFHRALELDPRLSRSQRPPQLRLGDS
jgi:Flp pilus assembly protein TadD